MASPERRDSISLSLRGVKPLGTKVCVGGLECVVRGLQLEEFGLVEGDADGGDDLISEVHARKLG